MHRFGWWMKTSLEDVEQGVEAGPLAGAIYGNPSPEPWHGFDARQRVVAFFTKAFKGKDWGSGEHG